MFEILFKIASALCENDLAPLRTEVLPISKQKSIVPIKMFITLSKLDNPLILKLRRQKIALEEKRGWK